MSKNPKLTWQQVRKQYELWNQAIYEHFINSAPHSGQVFLSVDEEVLDRIGNPFGKNREDFLQVIQARTIPDMPTESGHPEVAMHTFHAITTGNTPDYVGFLAAMVLAANWMEREAIEDNSGDGEGQVIDDNNYFFRLRQVLGLEEVKGRPPGLRNAEEAPFWEAWNEWLRRQDREPTAEEGESSYRYISYPLSQSMLHEEDKKRLAKLFWELVNAKRLSPTFDRDMLLGWMAKSRNQFPIPRLWQLLDRNLSRSRFEATAESIFELYSAIDWDADCEQCEKAAEQRVARRITAGLYREEDPIAGEVCYYLYPRQPKDWAREKVEVELRDGQWEPLRSERAEWCCPLPFGPEPPAKDLIRNVRATGSLQHLTQLVFPRRNYWVLVADPLTSGSAAFANWGMPVLGRSFVVLCRRGLERTMNLLHERNLINWVGDQLRGEEWREYLGCRILTADWPKLNLPDHAADLAENLRPRFKTLVYLDGGLRVPHERESWLECHPPAVEVLADCGQVRLYCEDMVRGGRKKDLGEHPVTTRVQLPVLVPGFYRVGARLRLATGKEQELTPRRFEIRSWDRLTCRAEVLANGLN
jgi:hypothetical protein